MLGGRVKACCCNLCQFSHITKAPIEYTSLDYIEYSPSHGRSLVHVVDALYDLGAKT